MAFHVGQRVVCVNGKFDHRHWGSEAIPSLPVENTTYTVRRVAEWKFSNGVHLSLWLEEIVNPVAFWTTGVSEAGFVARRFRPVKTTDISIFTSMLTKPPAKTKRVRA